MVTVVVDQAMKLLGISIGVVFLFVLGLLGIRQWGLSIPYQRFESPYFSSEQPLVIVRVENIQEADRLLTAWPKAILWVDVRKTRDGQFLLLKESSISQLQEKNFPADKWRGPFVPRYSLEELRSLFPNAPTLIDFIQHFPSQRFVLHIAENEPDIDRDLVQALEPLHVDDRVLIQSEVDAIQRTIKERKPLWIYGSSQPDLMKLMTFESLGLLPASPFRGDVMISALELSGRPAFNAAVLTEIHRRKKFFFLGPLRTTTEIERARKENPDGLIFDSVDLLLGK